ncbi:putative porin [bacterium]|nr:putative porin [bacterium]MBU1072467.1 putative porin [bacterium]MBU1674735.1 putative porin [bacterium]
MKSCALAALFAVLAAACATAGDWTETVTLSGDLRYRQERFDVDGSELRNRQRIRARLDLAALPEDNLELGFRLSSGSGDPVSGNQTLGDGFTTKSIMLDRAYFAWTHARSGAVITGGKMGIPFFAPSELLWDNDLSPEGLALAHTMGEGDTRFFVNGAGLWVEERSSAENSALFGAQAGLRQTLDGAWFVVGGSYFNYTDLAGPLYDGDFFGNSNDGAAFATDFNLVEVFVQLGFAAGELPVTVFADFVTNQEADADEQGYLFGARLGKAKKAGTWELKYNYREVQKDAVMGALTDSDFRGGGTDGKGHEFGFGYQLSGKSVFALTCFVNKLGVENGTDFKRLMADLKFRF